MERVLISRQTQVISQCVVDVIIVVLKMMLVVMINQDIRLISRGHVAFSGYGPDSLVS